jgi:hypothetical protein
MSAVVGSLASFAVLLLSGTLRRWPWRVAELSRAPDEPPGAADEPQRATDGSLAVVPSATSSATRSAVTGRDRCAPHAARAPTQRRGRHRDRASRATSGALERDLPMAIDLLALAVSAGHSLHTAVVSVATTTVGPVADALRDAVDGFERGGRLGEELARLPERHGAPLQPLVTTLTASLASGSPVLPALQRLGDAERRRLRRRTEERVRRLPVVLLAPLVGLVLPAFVIVTIVPVALTTARSESFAADFPRPSPHPPGAPHVPSVHPPPTRHAAS